jgi:Na+-driven multidrug efflux pump
MLTVMNFILSSFGDSAIAVMGAYFRVQSMVFMPVFGLSIGTMPVIGYNFGAKNKERMLKAIKFSISLAIGFMSFCLLIFQLFASQLLGMFSASEQMLEIGIPAFKTISLIFPLIAITIILSTSFQGLGKAYYSLMISAVRQLVVLLPAAYILSTYNNIDFVWYAFIIAEIVGVIIAMTVFIDTYHKSVLGWEEIS